MVDMYFTHGKITLHYEIYGNGYPLIMLHGNGEDITIFSKAIEKLESAFTIYAIDTRGHGKSSPIHEYHYSDMADDLYAFITELGIGRPAIFGFSDGGIAALLLEIKHPGTAGSLIVSGANTTPRALKLWFRISAWNAFQRTRNKLIDLMLSGPHISKEELQSIEVPVLVTAGERDLVKRSDTEAIASSIPDSTLMILPGEDHQSYIVHSDKIARIIIEAADERA